jgi:hypothetical protein
MFASHITHSTGMPALDARDDFLRARRAQLAARAARWLGRGRRRPNHPRTLPEPISRPPRGAHTWWRLHDEYPAEPGVDA